MAESGRINNPVVRNYICNFVPNKLESNPYFLKVYGRGFAKKMLQANIVNAYTNEPKGISTYAGYHRSDDKSITIVDVSQDGSLLTPEDIQHDSSLEEICVHESVHALLERIKRDCKKFGILSGTGLLEKREDANGRRFEIGRGLNEGYTEWMCEQAGYKTQAYPELTNMIRLLGTFIEPEKMMELGKGGIFTRYSKILGMDNNEISTLFAIADDLYFQNDAILKYENLESILRDYTQNPEAPSDVTKQKYDSYQPTMQYLRNTPDYAMFLTKNNLTDSDKSLQSYLKESLIPRHKDSAKIDYIRVESMILERYFDKEMNRIFSEESISQEDFDKCKGIMQLLNTSHGDIPQELYNSRPAYASLDFRTKFESLREKYVSDYDRTEVDKYRTGDFKALNYLAFLKDTYPNDHWKAQKHVDALVSQIAPKEFQPAVGRILDCFDNERESKEMLESLTHSKIFNIRFKDPNQSETSSLILSDGNFYNRYFAKSKQFSKDSTDQPSFDYTMADGLPDYQTAIAQFEALRGRVFQRNPDAKIYLASEKIIVKNDDDYSIFSVGKEGLVPMEIEGTYDFQCQLGEREIPKKEPGSLVVASKNPVLEFFNNIRGQIMHTFGKSKAPEIDYGDEKNSGTQHIALENTLKQYELPRDTVKSPKQHGIDQELGEKTEEPQRNDDDLIH